MEYFLLIFLILLNAVFAMSELALVSSRKIKLQKLQELGTKGATTAITLSEDPTRFMSTVQVGITLISLLNGIIGEATFARPLEEYLSTLGFTPPYAAWCSTGFVVVVITYLSIVLGELVPKRIGQAHPEAIACFVAPGISFLSLVVKPFTWALSVSTQRILSLFGVQKHSNQTVTEEEIHAILEEGSTSGAVDAQQHELVKNVFRLDDQQLNSLMIPRSEIALLSPEDTLEQTVNKVLASPQQWFPVSFTGSFDQIDGFVDTKKVLECTRHQTDPQSSSTCLRNILEQPLFVPETLTGAALLDTFREHRTHMAFVVDEYGAFIGMTTLQDLFEAVTGQFTPRTEASAWATLRADGSWLLEGGIALPELSDRLHIAELPNDASVAYHTLAGMLMFLMGKIPREGERVQWGQWQFEVIDLDGLRIDKVIAHAAPIDTSTTEVL